MADGSGGGGIAASHPSLLMTVKGVKGAVSLPAYRNIPDIIPPDQLAHLARKKLARYDMLAELATFRDAVDSDHRNAHDEILAGYVRPMPDNQRSVAPLGQKPQAPPSMPSKPGKRPGGGLPRSVRASSQAHGKGNAAEALHRPRSGFERAASTPSLPLAAGTKAMLSLQSAAIPMPIHMKY